MSSVQSTAAIFDMDGLLIDSEPIWRRVEKALFKEVGVNLTEEDCNSTTGLRLDEVISHWHKKFPWDSKPVAALHEEIIDAMARAIRDEAELMPGAVEAIELFRIKGLKTAVCSSSPYKLIEAMVEKFDLSAKLDAVHSAQYEPRGKPDPAAYLSAAKKLATPPAQCIALEDSIPGLMSAKSAGMRCILVAPEGHQNPTPDQYIRSLTELSLILGDIL